MIPFYVTMIKKRGIFMLDRKKENTFEIVCLKTYLKEND